MTATVKVQKPAKRKIWSLTVLAALLLIPLIYSFCVLAFVYNSVWSSGLKGGGNGPADAYRHSLASATVAHTLSPKIVYLITDIMEQDGVEKANPENIMDKHNNLLGPKWVAATL